MFCIHLLLLLLNNGVSNRYSFHVSGKCRLVRGAEECRRLESRAHTGTAAAVSNEWIGVARTTVTNCAARGGTNAQRPRFEYQIINIALLAPRTTIREGILGAVLCEPLRSERLTTGARIRSYLFYVPGGWSFCNWYFFLDLQLIYSHRLPEEVDFQFICILFVLRNIFASCNWILIIFRWSLGKLHRNFIDNGPSIS